MGYKSCNKRKKENKMNNIITKILFFLTYNSDTHAWVADQTHCDNSTFSILHLTLDLDHAQDGEEGEAEPGPGPRHVAPVPLAAGHPLPLALLPGPAPSVHALSLQKLHLKCFLSKL